MSLYGEAETGFNCSFFDSPDYDPHPNESAALYDCTGVSEEQILQDVYNSNVELQADKAALQADKAVLEAANTQLAANWAEAQELADARSVALSEA